MKFLAQWLAPLAQKKSVAARFTTSGPARLASKLETRYQQVLEAVIMVAQHCGAIPSGAMVRLLKETKDSDYYVVFELPHWDAAVLKEGCKLEKVFKYHLKSVFDVEVSRIVFVYESKDADLPMAEIQNLSGLQKRFDLLRRREKLRNQLYAQALAESQHDGVADALPSELHETAPGLIKPWPNSKRPSQL